MKPDETQEHYGDNKAQQDNYGKHLVLSLQVLDNDTPVCVKPSATSVNKRFVPKVALIDQVKCTEIADHATVNANASMHEEERDEVLVVVHAYAVVDPHAVVVKLLAAHVTQCAVL